MIITRYNQLASFQYKKSFEYFFLFDTEYSFGYLHIFFQNKIL